MKGYVQVYTGDGKGKTTAALGLTMRAAGAGLRVFLGQFIKGREYSEIRLLRTRFPEVMVEQYGTGKFIRGIPSPGEVAAGQAGLASLSKALCSGLYDVIIADEACTAVSAGLFAETDLLGLIREKPDSVELVFTGRGAGQALQDRADLVTEMRCAKHYFHAGVRGRRGIES